MLCSRTFAIRLFRVIFAKRNLFWYFIRSVFITSQTMSHEFIYVWLLLLLYHPTGWFTHFLFLMSFIWHCLIVIDHKISIKSKYLFISQRSKYGCWLYFMMARCWLQILNFNECDWIIYECAFIEVSNWEGGWSWRFHVE